MPAERIAAVLILVYIAMQTTHATVSALESGDVMKHKLLEVRTFRFLFFFSFFFFVLFL